MRNAAVMVVEPRTSALRIVCPTMVFDDSPPSCAARYSLSVLLALDSRRWLGSSSNWTCPIARCIN